MVAVLALINDTGQVVVARSRDIAGDCGDAIKKTAAKLGGAEVAGPSWRKPEEYRPKGWKIGCRPSKTISYIPQARKPRTDAGTQSISQGRPWPASAKHLELQNAPVIAKVRRVQVNTIHFQRQILEVETCQRNQPEVLFADTDCNPQKFSLISKFSLQSDSEGGPRPHPERRDE